MKKIITPTILVIAFVLTGCTTPRTVLENDKTGQIMTCGGRIPDTMLAYYIQKSNDEDCVNEMQSLGFKPISQTK